MADGMAYDFLTERLLSVRGAGGVVGKLSLPEVLRRLATGQIEAFTALRRHQRQAWYCFLAQLGAMVLHREGIGAADLPATTEEDWLTWLRNRTDGDAPWCLVVDDLSQAAIFQPPVPDPGFVRAGKEDKEKAWDVVGTPNELDVLDTARNHDVKMSLLAEAEPEHWLFALCTLQTTVGNLSGFYKSVARLGSTDGDRPMAGFVPGRGWGQRWQRDVAVALERREQLVKETQTAGRIELLWTEPWGRTLAVKNAKKGAELCDDQVSWTALDPYCIEVARRVRMAAVNETLVCRKTSMNEPRVAEPARIAGVGLRDIWLPLERVERRLPKKGAPIEVSHRAWVVGTSGLGYRRVVDLLFPRADGSGPQRCLPVDGDTGLHVSVHARAHDDKGKSAGLHERWVPIPAPHRNRFRAMAPDDPLAVRARELVKDAGNAQDDVLAPALRVLLGSGRRPEDEDAKQREALQKRLRHCVQAFDHAVDEQFFTLLGWNAEGDDLDTARQAWRRVLCALCDAHLARAAASMPIAGLRRERALATAEAVLCGRARRAGLLPADIDATMDEDAAEEVQ